MAISSVRRANAGISSGRSPTITGAGTGRSLSNPAISSGRNPNDRFRQLVVGNTASNRPSGFRTDTGLPRQGGFTDDVRNWLQNRDGPSKDVATATLQQYFC